MDDCVKKVGIGMIGYGGIGRIHALAYRAIGFHYGLPADTAHIAAVATSTPKTAQKAATEIGCDSWCADYRKLLDRDDVDLIDCCVPNDAHEQVVCDAAAAGKHIYCEKPLARTVTEGRRMVEAVRRAGVKTQMTFNFRFFPAITRAKQLVDEGFLGRVFSFRGRYYRASYISGDKPMSWRLSRQVSGGGALFDLGSHLLDLIYYLLGEFGSVQATLDTLVAKRPVAAGSSQMADVDVDDIALMHLRMVDGTLGLVEISRMGTGATNDLVIEIFGDRGAIRFNAANPTWLEIYDTQDASEPLGGRRGFRKLETAQRYEGQVAPDWSMTPGFVRTHVECQYRFLRAIGEDLSSSPTLDDGLHIQKVMEAAQQSSLAQRWIRISAESS